MFLVDSGHILRASEIQLPISSSMTKRGAGMGKRTGNDACPHSESQLTGLYQGTWEGSDIGLAKRRFSFHSVVVFQ